MKRMASAAVLGVGMLAFPIFGHAVNAGVTPAGVMYLAGGADAADRQVLEGMRSHYSAWLILRNRASGAALAGAHVRIIEARQHRAVFDRTLDAPWLLVALPEGRYQIEAGFDGNLQRSVVEAHGGGALPQVIDLRPLG